MKKVTVEAKNKKAAIQACKKLYGWTPDAVREVDSGDENTRAWMCFESARDAEQWDKQK